MWKAIFAVDPGGSTGVAWGVFNMQSATVTEAMATRQNSGSATITFGRVEKAGQANFQQIVEDQVRAITRLYNKFYKDELTEEPIDYVVEHFVLTAARHKPGIEGIFPAFLVGALIERSMGGLILQTAAKGMKWNKRDHLTRYNAWIRGKEHERAAFAHIAARLHDTLT